MIVGSSWIRAGIEVDERGVLTKPSDVTGKIQYRDFEVGE